MKRTLIAVAAAALCSTATVADSKPSDDEAKKIKATITEWGCEGGTEKETEASGTFEVDDAKCKGAQYDIKIDSAYKLISLSRD
jgi:hypothetical protein